MGRGWEERKLIFKHSLNVVLFNKFCSFVWTCSKLKEFKFHPHWNKWSSTKNLKPDKVDLSARHGSRSISPLSTVVPSIYHFVCHKIPWNKFQHLPRSFSLKQTQKKWNNNKKRRAANKAWPKQVEMNLKIKLIYSYAQTSHSVLSKDWIIYFLFM